MTCEATVVVEQKDIHVVGITEEGAVAVEQKDIHVVAEGQIGPPGPPGPPGSGGTQTLGLLAAQTLSGHRMVVATPGGAVYADPTDLAHADALLGLTVGAASAGNLVTVLAAGELTEPSWAWTPGLPLFVTPGGQLSHIPPSTGWVQIVALAVTATRILLTPRQSIALT